MSIVDACWCPGRTFDGEQCSLTARSHSVGGWTSEGDTRDVASHRLKRTMRGALAASAVVAAVSFTPAPATADTPSPNPPVSSDPVQAYQQLSKQADALNEQ